MIFFANHAHAGKNGADHFPGAGRSVNNLYCLLFIVYCLLFIFHSFTNARVRLQMQIQIKVLFGAPSGGMVIRPYHPMVRFQIRGEIRSYFVNVCGQITPPQRVVIIRVN